jgi:hypothetical protein
MDVILFCVKQPEFADNPLIDSGSIFAPFSMTQTTIYHTNPPEINKATHDFWRVTGNNDGNRVLTDEVGVENVPFPHELIRDPTVFHMGNGSHSRDSEYTPMQWDNFPFNKFRYTYFTSKNDILNFNFF